MTIRQRLLQKIKGQKSLKTSDLVKEFKASRQTIAFHVHKLVQEGLLLKEGSTRNASYHVVDRTHKINQPKHELHLFKEVRGLEEDRVYDEVALKMPFEKKLSKNAQSIVFYAFSEMLNNAIDHSRSKKVEILIKSSDEDFEFTIRDFGIGIFENIKKTFHLKDEFEALEHLLKGKQTTMPERHSGEGIFFTSKIADCFKIRSHKLNLSIDNQIDDIFVKENRPVKGTEVFFSIKTKSKKSLQKLFKEYANEDFEFDKNLVKIKLTTYQGLVSRSQARRLVEGLNKFKQIILDFKGVEQIGQAFADEVFRVFQNRHPDIQIIYRNALPAVEFMIQRALK